VYQSGSAETSELVWFDRSGKRIESLGDPANYAHPRISHDGRRVVFVVTDPQSSDTDLWLYDFERRARTRFTFGPAVNIFPVWSPDDSRIVFASNRQAMHELYQRLTTGAGEDELVLGWADRDSVARSEVGVQRRRRVRFGRRLEGDHSSRHAVRRAEPPVFARRTMAGLRLG
jgi:tricorn protease-like protein